MVRATLVGLLALWAMAAGRPARSAYPLLVAFGAMIAWTPRSISDPGLILSFSAVVGILVLAEPLRRALVRVVPAPVAVALAVSAAATLATAPASALIFGQVSLVGLVANLVAVPVAGIVLVAGLTGALTACVAPAAGALPLAALISPTPDSCVENSTARPAPGAETTDFCWHETCLVSGIIVDTDWRTK